MYIEVIRQDPFKIISDLTPRKILLMQAHVKTCNKCNTALDGIEEQGKTSPPKPFGLDNRSVN